MASLYCSSLHGPTTWQLSECALSPYSFFSMLIIKFSQVRLVKHMGGGKKPSLFFMLSRVSLFITLKYEQVFFWNFNAVSFAAQCLFSSAWLALQRWRCCFCGFLSVVRPKFRGTKLKPSKKKKEKKEKETPLLFRLWEDTHYTA